MPCLTCALPRRIRSPRSRSTRSLSKCVCICICMYIHRGASDLLEYASFTHHITFTQSDLLERTSFKTSHHIDHAQLGTYRGDTTSSHHITSHTSFTSHHFTSHHTTPLHFTSFDTWQVPRHTSSSLTALAAGSGYGTHAHACMHAWSLRYACACMHGHYGTHAHACMVTFETVCLTVHMHMRPTLHVHTPCTCIPCTCMHAGHFRAASNILTVVIEQPSVRACM